LPMANRSKQERLSTGKLNETTDSIGG
jgi:hypothetical protein